MSQTGLGEVFNSNGCSIEYRRVEGPDACELFFLCRPSEKNAPAGRQAEAVYLAISEFLAAQGAPHQLIASETLFFQNIRRDLLDARAARARVLASALNITGHPAPIEIEQPPVSNDTHLEVIVHAIVGPRRFETNAVKTEINHPDQEHDAACGRLIELGGETRFYTGLVYGQGVDAYEQTQAMFKAAETLVRKAGLSFNDVMRTWIYFADMERDYAGFNRARRAFFQSRNVDPIPASTGIGAAFADTVPSICMSLYAASGAPPVSRSVMATPTLNEAPDYGSDFSRGMRVEERNRTSLYVSGTASLDENGATVHLAQFEQQAQRMLLNVAGLLEQQDADFSDICYAITYIKHAEDAPLLRDCFAEAGYLGFPNAIVVAPVCRSELLCETEALAVTARR